MTFNPTTVRELTALYLYQGVRAAREEKLSALRSRRDRLEIRWHAAHDVLTHIEDQLTAVEAGIAALEDME